MSWVTVHSDADIVFALSKAYGIERVKDRCGYIGKSSAQEILSSLIKYVDLSDVERSIIQKSLTKLKKLNNFK